MEHPMSTHSPEHADDPRHAVAHGDGHSDRKLSMAILIMVSLLAILFALVVPIGISMLHRASGY
jgi:hypothetical protein